MTELTFNLPEKGEARSASDGKVREGLSKIKETVNGKLTDENLSSPNNKAYKTLLVGTGTGTINSTTKYLALGGVENKPPQLQSGVGSTWAIESIFLVPADHEVSGKTTKLRLRWKVLGASGGTSEEPTITGGLYPITTGVGSYAVGSVVAGSTSSIKRSVATFAEIIGGESPADFTIPSEGLYAFGIKTDKGTVTNAATWFHLQVRNV